MLFLTFNCFLKVSSAGGEKEWYFFCLRGRKYRNSIRPNRVTGSGFWKATGIDRPICSSTKSGECIGLKKSLVYYRGSAGKGTKTDWMMHEFRLPPAGSKNGADNTNPSLQEAVRLISRTSNSYMISFECAYDHVCVWLDFCNKYLFE